MTAQIAHPSLTSGGDRPLSGFLARARIAKALPFIKGDVLDLGCGKAALFDIIKDREGFDSYTGIEMLESDVQLLEGEHTSAHFLARNLEAKDWSLGRQFDSIVGLALIEHIWNQGDFMTNVAAALRKGGHAVFTTPTVTGNDLVLPVLSLFGLVRKDVVDDHIVIFNRKRFEHAAREHGLRMAHYSTFQFGQNQLAVLAK